MHTVKLVGILLTLSVLLVEQLIGATYYNQGRGRYIYPVRHPKPKYPNNHNKYYPSCPQLVSPNYGTVTTGLYHGSRYRTAVYECHHGYQLVGSKTRQCVKGRWGGTPPVCKKNCPPVQQRVLYSCNEGYILMGKQPSNNTNVIRSSLECNTDHLTCQAVDCGPLSPPTNGSVSLNRGTLYTSQATYSCNNGFNLIGNQLRFCQANGQWSNEEPTCSDTIINDTTTTTATPTTVHMITCPKMSPPKNGKIHATGYYPADRISLTCNYGYKLYNGRERIVCLHNGNWSGALGNCIKKSFWNRMKHYIFG